MTVERRFETGARGTPSTDPGLVLGDDGIAYVVAPDGSRTAVGSGGSSASVGSEQVYGNPTGSVAAGDLASLTFDSFGQGDDLLDFTVPTLPVVKVAGLYTVTINAFPGEDMSSDAQFYMTLTLDAAGQVAYAVNNSASAYPGSLRPENSTTVSYFIPLGGAILATVRNADSIAHTFAIDVAVISCVVASRMT